MVKKGGGKAVDRCQTGVRGFDIISNGGFVRESTNTIVGGSGSGKTIFLLQFLYNGATIFNENGLYVTFESDLIEVFKDAEVMGWDFSSLDKDGRVKFVKFSPQMSVAEMKTELTKLVSKYDIKRICIDPINVFALQLEKGSKIRSVIFDLAALLKRMKSTVLFAEESSTTLDLDAFGSDAEMRGSFLKFLVDCVVEFHSSGLGGVSDRAVRITKMRRTNHSRGPIPMQITDNGIIISPGK